MMSMPCWATSMSELWNPCQGRFQRHIPPTARPTATSPSDDLFMDLKASPIEFQIWNQAKCNEVEHGSLLTGPIKRNYNNKGRQANLPSDELDQGTWNGGRTSQVMQRNLLDSVKEKLPG